MSSKRRFTIVYVTIMSLCLALIFNWYRSSEDLLSQVEIEQFIDRISTEQGEALEFLDIETTRDFLENDDGAPFFVVNLFRFATQVRDPEDSTAFITGKEAFDRFTRRVLPVWAKHGSHPVFASKFVEPAYGQWDYTSVVRYRSRRDYAEVLTSADYLEALPLRLAAGQENERAKVAGNSVPIPVALLLLCLVLAALIVLLLIRSAYGRSASA